MRWCCCLGPLKAGRVKLMHVTKRRQHGRDGLCNITPIKPDPRLDLFLRRHGGGALLSCGGQRQASKKEFCETKNDFPFLSSG